MAYAQVGIEECRKNILFVQAIDPLIEKSWTDPADRSSARRVLLDLIRYYVSIGAQFEEMLARTKHLMGDPSSWRYSSQLKDPITGQLVNVEDPNGGGIDLKLVQKLVSTDLRSKSLLDLANSVASGSQDPKAVPKIESWSQLSSDSGPAK